jgi:hypothetical protein
MPGSFSNSLETLTLTWALSATAVTRPTVWYVGLFTDAAGIVTDQPTTEAVSGTCPGYVRKQILTPFWTISGGQAQNAAAVTFTATGAWLTVNYVGIWDAATTGNLIAWASISAKTLANTDDLLFDINAITITLD